jgi:SAM-dependent methyltransferase
MPRLRFDRLGYPMNAPPRLFDRELLRSRRERAAARGAENFLLNRAAEDIEARLSTVARRFSLALDLGTPGEELRRALKGKIEQVVACEPLAHLRDAPLGPRVAADEEALPFGEASFDLVVSALALHWANDLPGVLKQVLRALKPDGLFLAALVGGESLTELRQCLGAAEAEVESGASPRVAPFVEVRALGALLQRAGFALPVTDVDRVTVRYSHIGQLFADLRAMGATNPLVERRRVPLRRETLFRAGELYAQKFADPDGRLRATFDLLWVSGWAPHHSQQQPLRPGSAKVRLADALGTHERKAGERAQPARKPGSAD